MNPKVSQKPVVRPLKPTKSSGPMAAPPAYLPQQHGARHAGAVVTAKSSAPPVYRPQAPAQAKLKPVRAAAPPVYRPQLPVQAKSKAAGATAPAVFRPQGIAPKPSGASAAPVYRPTVLQMVKVKKPAGLVLTGGDGVSVIWKKSKTSDLPHVSVCHGKSSSGGMIEVTNFHYKFAPTGYYQWDDKGTGIFKFRGGSPTKGVYVQTQKGATKFGINLEKPANIVEQEAEEAALAKAAAERAAAERAAAAKLAAAKAPKPLSSQWDGEDGFVAVKPATSPAPTGSWEEEWT